VRHEGTESVHHEGAVVMPHVAYAFWRAKERGGGVDDWLAGGGRCGRWPARAL